MQTRERTIAAEHSSGGHSDYPWPLDEEEETLPGLPLTELPPGLLNDPYEDEADEEVTQKVQRSSLQTPVSERADTEDSGPQEPRLAPR